MLIAPHCDLPDSALRQHVAILGKTGSGKTYTAKGIIEKLLERPQQVAIIDPTGAWWGLRSSRDGSGPGFPVLVLGGDHADIPLPPKSGTAAARMVAEQLISVVIDTSRLTIGERARWFIDFAGELYRAVRRPLTLVIDEVHNFAPQGRVPDPDTGKMLHAANQLFSGGRSRGIRLVGISQRPAKWHKDSLTCVDTMIAMRMLAPQDREAVEAWIEGCGDRKLGRQVLDSLAQLGTGEGWVWYPEGGLLQRVKFPGIRTFDSSRTPEDGGPIPAPRSRAEIDLAGIEAAMSAAIEEARATDPQLLAAEVNDLRRKLADATRAPIAPDAGELAGLREDLVHAQTGESSARRTLGKVIEYVSSKLDQAEHELRHARQYLEELQGIGGPHTPAPVRAAIAGGIAREARASARLDRDPDGQTICVGPDDPPNGGATGSPPALRALPRGAEDYGREILRGLARLHAVGLRTVSRQSAGAMAGKSPRSSQFERVLASLRADGSIDFPGPGEVAITPAGLKRAGRVDSPASLRELHAAWLACPALDDGQRRILEFLITHRGSTYRRADLAAHVGISPKSSQYERQIAGLKDLGLIAYPATGAVAVGRALLFPDGLR